MVKTVESESMVGYVRKGLLHRWKRGEQGLTCRRCGKAVSYEEYGKVYMAKHGKVRNLLGGCPIPVAPIKVAPIPGFAVECRGTTPCDTRECVKGGTVCPFFRIVRQTDVRVPTPTPAPVQ